MCLERCEDWACTDRCSGWLDNEDSLEAYAALSACGQENGCSPGDDDCLDNACNSEFITFFSTCLDDGGDGMPFDGSCSEFIECAEICSTWECTESCQTTSITDDAINAAVDALQACGAAAACTPDSDDCLAYYCSEEQSALEGACMASDGYTPSDGDTSGGTSDDPEPAMTPRRPAAVIAVRARTAATKMDVSPLSHQACLHCSPCSWSFISNAERKPNRSRFEAKQNVENDGKYPRGRSQGPIHADTLLSQQLCLFTMV